MEGGGIKGEERKKECFLGWLVWGNLFSYTTGLHKDRLSSISDSHQCPLPLGGLYSPPGFPRDSLLWEYLWVSSHPFTHAFSDTFALWLSSQLSVINITWLLVQAVAPDLYSLGGPIICYNAALSSIDEPFWFYIINHLVQTVQYQGPRKTKYQTLKSESTF